jgi:thiosulfate reductase cytochrome b subunit
MSSDSAAATPRWARRHRLATRLWHWVNALVVFVMLMSGLMIFNAHPRLYWGHYGANADPAWLSVGSTESSGFVDVAGMRIPTTGVVGRWRDPEGEVKRRAFPWWATIPSYYSLSGARRWHLAFAWLLVVPLIAFALASLANRHFRRDLAPTRDELKPGHVWRDIVDHARLRYPTGEAALRYNILQKLAYAGLVLLLLPLLILTGLAMSPAMDAAWPWLVDLFGGRQSARSIHFIAAMLVALFIIIHLIQVVLAGPLNHVRSMVTGWFRVPPPRGEGA